MKIRKRSINRIGRISLVGMMLLASGLTVNADDGNTHGSATSITPGTRSASLTTGDEDWFRFTTTSTGQVAIYTRGLTNTYGRLYDAAGTYLGIADDSSGTGVNFSIERQLAAGTYYLRVTPGFSGALTGDYTLTLRTQESAPFVTGSTFSGNLALGQIDFYRVQLEANGLFEVYTTGLTNTYGSLFDEVGTHTGYANDSSGAGANFHLKLDSFAPGTYLVKIEGGFSGAVSGPYEGFVLRPALAETIGEGGYARTLSPLGDVDHFTFSLAKAGKVRIWTAGTTNTYGQIYNAVGVNEGIANDNSGSGSNFYIERTMNAGQYYLRVSGGFSGSLSGAYQLYLDLPGLSPAQAALKARLYKKLESAKKQLKRAKSKSAKKRLRKKIASLRAQIRALI